ncbi:MAG: amino acid-binding protein, partial [Rhodospirillales bacterium]|nr:amino acid-binding protein [Rhodospirillales bacterium]
GQGAEFTSVVELPGGINLDALNAELSSLAVLGDAEIKVSDFKLAPLQGPTGQITHQITLTGGDQPGLIARLCEVFIEFKANIVRLVTEPTADGLYIMRLSVFIPKNAADACLATVKNTAENLQMSFTSEGL